MTTNHLPPSLVSNLQSVLIGRKVAGGGDEEGRDEPDPEAPKEPSLTAEAMVSDSSPEASKPVVLVTNGDGIGSPGLVLLVSALVRDGRYDVHVCAPESDKSASGHSVTVQETLSVNSTDVAGASAFEVSGTPADCVSLALSGALFPWSKPALVVSGVNKGSSCGHHVFYSGAIAGAKEALLRGVPSISISLNWKKDESQESDFKDAVDVCLPLVHAAIRDIEKGHFPQSCMLNVEIPTSPSMSKGFKVTRQTLRRAAPSWQAVSSSRHPSTGQFMSMHQSLGIQLAQLSRDASAAGAARRVNTHRPNVEIESVAAAGKAEGQRAMKKYFRLEFLDKEQEDVDEDLDFRALKNGFIAVTPLNLHSQVEPEIQASASDWLTSALTISDEAP